MGISDQPERKGLMEEWGVWGRNEAGKGFRGEHPFFSWDKGRGETEWLQDLWSFAPLGFSAYDKEVISSPKPWTWAEWKLCDSDEIPKQTRKGGPPPSALGDPRLKLHFLPEQPTHPFCTLKLPGSTYKYQGLALSPIFWFNWSGVKPQHRYCEFPSYSNT